MEELQSKRGKPITCKYCKHEFRFELLSQREEWKLKNYPCPICAIDLCILPPTERELRHLQVIYLQTRLNKDLVPMITVLKSYCASLIKKSFSNKIQEPGKLEYYVHTAVTFLVEDYLAKPHFNIQTSFGGYLIHKIRQAIWGTKEYDIDAESIDFEYEEGGQVQYADNKKSIIDLIEQQHDKKQLVHYLSELIFGVEDFCLSRAENYIRLLNVANHLDAGEQSTDKFFKCYDKTGKLKYIQTMEIIRNELKGACFLR